MELAAITHLLKEVSKVSKEVFKEGKEKAASKCKERKQLKNKTVQYPQICRRWGIDKEKTNSVNLLCMVQDGSQQREATAGSNLGSNLGSMRVRQIRDVRQENRSHQKIYFLLILFYLQIVDQKSSSLCESTS